MSISLTPAPGNGGGGASSVSAEEITDATATGIALVTAADQAAARTAIGAGSQTELDQKLDAVDAITDLSDMSGTLADTQLFASVLLQQPFTSANYATQARPTARTDVSVLWKGDASTNDTMTPANSISGDIILTGAS